MSALSMINKLNQATASTVNMQKAVMQFKEFKNLEPARRKKAVLDNMKVTRGIYEEWQAGQEYIKSSPETIAFGNNAKRDVRASRSIPLSQINALVLNGKPNADVLYNSTQTAMGIMKNAGVDYDARQRVERQEVGVATTAAGLDLPTTDTTSIADGITKSIWGVNDADLNAMSEDAEVIAGEALSGTLQRVMEKAQRGFKELNVDGMQVGPEQRLTYAVAAAVADEGDSITAQEGRLVTQRAVDMLENTQVNKVQGAQAALPAQARQLQENAGNGINDMVVGLRGMDGGQMFASIGSSIGYNNLLKEQDLHKAGVQVTGLMNRFSNDYGKLKEGAKFGEFVQHVVSYGKQNGLTGNDAQDTATYQLLDSMNSSQSAGTLNKDFPGMAGNLRELYKEFNLQYDDDYQKYQEKALSKLTDPHNPMLSTRTADGQIFHWKPESTTTQGVLAEQERVATILSDQWTKDFVIEAGWAHENAQGDFEFAGTNFNMADLETMKMAKDNMHQWQDIPFFGSSTDLIGRGELSDLATPATRWDETTQIAWGSHINSFAAMDTPSAEDGGWNLDGMRETFTFNEVDFTDTITGNQILSDLFRQSKTDVSKRRILMNMLPRIAIGEVDNNAIAFLKEGEDIQIGQELENVPDEHRQMKVMELKNGGLSTLHQQASLLSERYARATDQFIQQKELFEGEGAGNLQMLRATDRNMKDLESSMFALKTRAGATKKGLPTNKSAKALEGAFGYEPPAHSAVHASLDDSIGLLSAFYTGRQGILDRATLGITR